MATQLSVIVSGSSWRRGMSSFSAATGKPFVARSVGLFSLTKEYHRNMYILYIYIDHTKFFLFNLVFVV